MISFPNCKINLGLDIIRKRPDGFHDLETVFYPLPFTDVLEIIPANGSNNSLSITGITIPGDSQKNLCVRAWELLRKDFGSLPFVDIHLHKIIPAGSGLGGGSADGAFMLRMLNEYFELGLSREQLTGYAAQLGSDCPFFIINKTCFSTGRGEMLEEIDLDLSDYSFLLVNPGIHNDTGKLFGQLSPAPPSHSLRKVIQGPIGDWKLHLKNDFEKVVFTLHPEIKKIKEDLYESGAVYAAMSGSGSSVFGIFHKQAVPELSFPPHYFVRKD